MPFEAHIEHENKRKIAPHAKWQHKKIELRPQTMSAIGKCRIKDFWIFDRVCLCEWLSQPQSHTREHQHTICGPSERHHIGKQKPMEYWNQRSDRRERAQARALSIPRLTKLCVNRHRTMHWAVSSSIPNDLTLKWFCVCGELDYAEQ